MRIEVVPHRRIHPLLRQWRDSLPGTREEQVVLSQRLWGAFVRLVEVGRGIPEQSWKDATTNPPTYWCDFPGCGLARIYVKPDRRVRLFRHVRRVIVIDLNFSPGLLEIVR